MRNLMLICLFLLLLLFSFGCADEEAASGHDEEIINVVTTIYPLADLIDQLGGEKVDVNYLLPAGASPHTYEPTVEEAKLINQADLFIYIGAELDNWAVKMSETAGTGLLVADMSEHIPIIESAAYHKFDDDQEGHDHEHNDYNCENDDCSSCSHDHGPQDPHYWLDPLIVRDSLSSAIHDQLVELAPENEDYFDQKLEEYTAELTILHEEIKETVSGFSQQNFIAFHSAWQYFAERYKLNEVAVVAQFPGQEPSAGWVAELVGLIRDKEIGAIFAEPQFSDELAERIAEESGTEVLVLDPLGGENVPGRKSYLDLMRYNLSVFEEAMQ